MIASRPMSTRPVSLAAAGAMLCAATALWTTLGAVTFADAQVDAQRIGVLPSLGHLAAFITAGIVTLAIGRPSARFVAPLWLSGILLVPWLPLPLPLSVFVWSGPLRIWLWVVVAAALAVSAVQERARRRWTPLTPVHNAILAGALAALAYGFGASAVSPRHPTGDEPHYLVITQSLLQDRDLKIENNHRQGDYLAYFQNPLKPHYLQRGKDGAIYSIHAPGLPVLVAPAFALFGYHGVVAALVIASAFGAALVWFTAWRVTRDHAASWFAWATVSLSVPFFFHAPAVFPDGMGALLTLIGILPLVDDRFRMPRGLVAIGAALATLPWLHTRFAVLAGAAGLAIAARLTSERSRRIQRLTALFAIPVVSAIAWLAFFQVIYGTPNPSAPYGSGTQSSPTNIVRGMSGLLLDQQFGLLPNAPVYVCAIAGLAVMLRYGPRRLAIEVTAVCASYVVLVATFYMWWGGFSAPARFLVPITLPLTVPAAVWFATRKTTAARLAGAGALAASLLATATIALVERGGLLFNVRDAASRLALWLSPVVNVTTALPSLFQDAPHVVVLHGSIWLVALAVPVAVGLGVDHARRSPPLTLVVMGIAFAAATTTAVSVVWRNNKAMPVTPASGGTELLRRVDPDARQIALRYRPFGRLQAADLVQRITLARTFSAVNHVPAGVYEVSGVVSGAAGGHVWISTDESSPPLERWDLSSSDHRWTRQIVLPVAVSQLRLDGDEAGRRALAEISLRPVVVAGRRARLNGDVEAGRGARYNRTVVFRLAGSSYFEPTGFWVPGGGLGEFAIVPDPHSRIRLLVRNAPVDNEVVVESGSWRERWTLTPGEERIVDLAADARRPGAILTIQSLRGARPVDFDPNSDDERLLGCWIEFR